MAFLVPVAVLFWHVLVFGLCVLMGQMVFFAGSLLGLRVARWAFYLVWFGILVPLGVVGSVLVHLPILCEKFLEVCGMSPRLSAFVVVAFAISVAAPQLAVPLGVGLELAAEGWNISPPQIEPEFRDYYLAKGRCFKWGLGGLFLAALATHALLLTVFRGLLDSWELFLRA